MIVLKKSTTSFTILNLGMHEYRSSSRDYELSHKIHPFRSISQCKSLWIFPEKETDHRCIVYFEKERDAHDSEAEEKPQKH